MITCLVFLTCCSFPNLSTNTKSSLIWDEKYILKFSFVLGQKIPLQISLCLKTEIQFEKLDEQNNFVLGRKILTMKFPTPTDFQHVFILRHYISQPLQFSAFSPQLTRMIYIDKALIVVNVHIGVYGSSNNRDDQAHTGGGGVHDPTGGGGDHGPTGKVSLLLRICFYFFTARVCHISTVTSIS